MQLPPFNQSQFHHANVLRSYAKNISSTPPSEIVRRDPLFVAVPLTFFYSVILIAGVIGNVITCIVILKNKYLHTATNYYLFSLAVSDLLLLTLGLPQEMYYIWSRYPYIFGETFCIVRGFMAEASANASVLTITAFTIERYVAICHPFLAHTISNLSRAIKYVLLIWVISLLCAAPLALQFGIATTKGPEFLMCTMTKILVPHAFEYSMLIFFIIPMIAITILYIRVAFKLRSSVKLQERRSSRPMLSYENQSISSQKLIVTGHPSGKTVKMLVAVVITFFACWAPFHFQRLIAAWSVATPDAPVSPTILSLYDTVTHISAILYYTSSTVNPILYHTMSHKFRGAFKDTLNCMCYRNENSKSGGNNSELTRRSSPIGLYQNGTKSKTANSNNSTLKYTNITDGLKVTSQIVNETVQNDENNGEQSDKEKEASHDLNDNVPYKNDEYEKIVKLLNDTSEKMEKKSVGKKKILVWYENKKIINSCVS